MEGIGKLTSAMLFATIWALAAAWASPSRNWIASGMLLALLMVAAGSIAVAMRITRPTPRRDELNRELSRDRELLTELQQRRAG